MHLCARGCHGRLNNASLGLVKKKNLPVEDRCPGLRLLPASCTSAHIAMQQQMPHAFVNDVVFFSTSAHMRLMLH